MVLFSVVNSDMSISVALLSKSSIYLKVFEKVSVWIDYVVVPRGAQFLPIGIPIISHQNAIMSTSKDLVISYYIV